MLKVNHLYVSFVKEYFTLNDISLSLGNNQKLVIVGNKESGRTAFLRSLLGLENIAKGEILYKNTSVEKINFKDDISLGYIPAHPSFLERKTVKQNIEYVLKIRKENIKFLEVKINNALNEYGLNYIKNKKVKDLSYFDRLKLSLARLCVRNLDMIYVDDIFVTLSSLERSKMIKYIKELIKNNCCSAIIMTEDENVASEFGYQKKYLIYGSLMDNKEENN
ncbi:MAG: ATP-binding cassette domain-containing protein [Clostridiales bacterium]|nr:ATP-binding cassette domain-containing protein [Clostridiales bacterium]